MSKEEQVHVAEIIRVPHVGPLRSVHGCEDPSYRLPTVHVYHRHLVDEQNLEGQQLRHFGVPALRDVQFGLQFAVKFQQSVNGSRLDARSY